MTDLKHIIKNCTKKLKEPFTEGECEILSASFEFHELAENEVLLREGERDDALSIIVDGDISVTRDSGGGEFVTLQHLHAGDVAGAMGFIDGSNHTATLRANKLSHVITLHKRTLESMVDRYPKLVYKLMRMIIRSVHKTVLRMDQQFVEMNNYIMKAHGRY